MNNETSHQCLISENSAAAKLRNNVLVVQVSLLNKRKRTMIRSWYNQGPYPTLDTKWEREKTRNGNMKKKKKKKKTCETPRDMLFSSKVVIKLTSKQTTVFILINASSLINVPTTFTEKMCHNGFTTRTSSLEPENRSARGVYCNKYGGWNVIGEHKNG